MPLVGGRVRQRGQRVRGLGGGSGHCLFISAPLPGPHLFASHRLDLVLSALQPACGLCCGPAPMPVCAEFVPHTHTRSPCSRRRSVDPSLRILRLGGVPRSPALQNVLGRTGSDRAPRSPEQNFQNGHMNDSDLPWGPTGPSRMWMEVTVGSALSAIVMSVLTLLALSFCGLFRV